MMYALLDARVLKSKQCDVMFAMYPRGIHGELMSDLREDNLYAIVWYILFIMLEKYRKPYKDY